MALKIKQDHNRFKQIVRGRIKDNLRKYLQKQCAYSLGAAAVPQDEDAAAYFVLKSRRGACDLFATALAVMSRTEPAERVA